MTEKFRQYMDSRIRRALRDAHRDGKSITHNLNDVLERGELALRFEVDGTPVGHTLWVNPFIRRQLAAAMSEARLITTNLMDIVTGADHGMEFIFEIDTVPTKLDSPRLLADLQSAGI